ncbi:S8 family serine peptidase [Limnoraphis robusta]|uniref:S8 family serine peptidase n=1 Tax=Limnoraphis robusta TaxID=1118279 RepID=UPI002B21A024|nr:S8 family serine peptidase [Limnoraphis robusta]MEA5546077.1 S8 family serine peptidase [Limnoraphis robusta CCNP1324]
MPQVALSTASDAVSSVTQSEQTEQQVAISSYEAQVQQDYQRRFTCVETQEFSRAEFERQFAQGLLTGTNVKDMAARLASCVSTNNIRNVNLSSLVGVVYTTEKQGDQVVLVVGVGLRAGGDPEISPPDETLAKGKERPGLPEPSRQVDGSFQIFESSVPGCEKGYYEVSGQFNENFTQFTLNQARGAEGCFSSVPVQLFTASGLVDAEEPIEFESNAGPGGSRIAGSISQIYGSFSSPIIYPDASGDTFGILALNSENTEVRDPRGEELTDETTVITELPAPGELKVSEVLPDLLPDAATENEQQRDTRSDSDTSGLIVVRNQLRVVFSDDAKVEDINAALKATGSGIISSAEGVTAITLKIPDTGDLDGVDNVEQILSTQPSVVTTVPVIIDEVPDPTTDDLIMNEFPEQGSVTLSSSAEMQKSIASSSYRIISNSQPEKSQNYTIAQEPNLRSIPHYLRVMGAIDSSNTLIEPSGNDHPPNLFIVDWFSMPMNNDLTLVNPVYKRYSRLFEPFLGMKDSAVLTARKLIPFKQNNALLEFLHNKKLSFNLDDIQDSSQSQDQTILVDNWFCRNVGFFCNQKVGVNKGQSLDQFDDRNIAIFNDRSASHIEDKKTCDENNDCDLNTHGFLVGGIMAAHGNKVVGMYPSTKRVFAFNAVASNWQEKLLFTLQKMSGNHVVNFSGALTKNSIQLPDGRIIYISTRSVSERQGKYWATQIRQRGLENRVLLVQAAGNDSNMLQGRVIDAEDSGIWTAAGLVDTLTEQSKEKKCGSFGSRIKRFFKRGSFCKTVTKTNKIPRLKNVLVVENLHVDLAGCSLANIRNPRCWSSQNRNTYEGSYNRTSNIVSNRSLGVRAFGTDQTPCLINSSSRGFPSLSSNDAVDCTELGGTSSAAPQVAGLAAWLWSVEPSIPDPDRYLTAPELADLIRRSQRKFQVLDLQGNPAVDSNNTPVMSNVNAISVREAFKELENLL